MKVVLLRVGKGRNAWADAGVLEYARRLPRNLELEERLLRPATFQGDPEAVKEEEARRILGELKDGDRLFALDERGEIPTSEGFAGWIDESARLSCRRMVFAIGGPYGHGAAVRSASARVLALSKMVLNHELARMVLVEQLYRASTLLWGGAYHH
jgi:23S rRNA (pseudouridine1915-N3)-methyltransferase